MAPTSKTLVSKTGGRLAHFFPVWRRVTDDPMVLSVIRGYVIPFCNNINYNCVSTEPNWSCKEKQEIAFHISNLLDLGAIVKCDFVHNQFLSGIFLVPKSDGTSRLILNLKNLNKYINTSHFKMEDWRTVSCLLRRNMFMATLDIKDAYYHIPIHKDSRKFLRFLFKGQLYEFTCLPFGLCTAPLIFTKILKPIFGRLRSKGLLSVTYLDDFLLLGDSYENCSLNVSSTRSLLCELGFIVNDVKSQLIPSKVCTFLGFCFDSVNMTIGLPEKKIASLLALLNSFDYGYEYSLRNFARLVGKLVSSCPAVRFGWVHFKSFERFKFIQLIVNNKSFDDMFTFPVSLARDLIWWKTNLMISTPIRTYRYALEIFSDASKTGWGVCCQGKTARGVWTVFEQTLHINSLELLAAFYGLICFAFDYSNCEILLRIDNKTAIAYINKFGGTKYFTLNTLARDIWDWCENRKIFFVCILHSFCR
uniref:Reverse transcriptase domain-containing protein n=2 Tax=Photinus pyralis TaxID=7054 RepID=A0A1Y1N1R8_PHOPY